LHIVVIHNWQRDDAEVAEALAAALDILVFEARQKIAGGGPRVLISFAEQHRAEALAARLSTDGVPAFVLDPVDMRNESWSFTVRRFVLQEHSVQLESTSGELCSIDYDKITLLLVANYSAGQIKSTSTTTERKFSVGKTVLAGGMPMSKKVTTEQTITSNERDETVRLYAQNSATVLFDRNSLNYDGLGDAMQMTRDLNFNRLKSSLRQLASRAGYDDRLLKQAELVRLIGPSLNPETDLDLAFEILSRSLFQQRSM
jgi:hypothetical protein